MIVINDESRWALYVHTNKKNGKRYVGISQNPVKRWDSGRGYFNNKPFYNAIKRYGWNDGFAHDILLTGLTTEEASEKEKEYIELYQSNNLQFGYNQTSGGLGNPEGYLNKNLYDENLPPLRLIKASPIKKQIFIKLLESALGGQELTETITKITYENGKEIKKEIETKSKILKPNEDAVKSILKNYSEEQELKNIIDRLTKIKEEGDFEDYED